MEVDVTTPQPQTAGAQAFLAPGTKKMLIGGDWSDAESGERLDTRDPANGNVLGSVPRGSAADIDKAVKAARQSFDSGVWRNMTPDDRGRILWKVSELIEANIDELAELETLDQGKPLFVGRWAEIPGAAMQFRYFAGLASKIQGETITPSINYQPPGKNIFAYTQKEPIGVVGAITPWNSPLVLEAMKIAPCLAAGCSMILKPAEDTSLTAIRLGELILEAGVPEGVFNIVTGLGPEAGQALVEHPDVDKITFTGSTATGRTILETAARSNLKKVALELGGKSPSIVMADAEMDIAIPGVANAIFFNSGQVCVAGSRLYIHKKVYDDVLAGVADIAANMKLGHGLNPEVQIGPLVNRTQADRVKRYIDGGVADGAEVVVGGEQCGETGNFITPTVIANTRQDMSVVQEEIFGPVVVAAPIDSIDDVPAMANASRYGLAASVWTQDISSATRLASAIKAGTVWINCHLMFDAALPIGGYKESGWSRDSGIQAIDHYLETKTVCAVV
jgi:phenylacetaldehyde dehydrogenase